MAHSILCPDAVIFSRSHFCDFGLVQEEEITVWHAMMVGRSIVVASSVGCRGGGEEGFAHHSGSCSTVWLLQRRC